jgi:transcriptional regulator with XRE-family HTH domain
VAAGVSAIHYGRYERGQALPNSEALKRLADVLEVSGDYLLGGSNQDGARANFEDRELLALFQEVQTFSDKDKEVVKTFLDAFVVKKKIQTLAAS